MKCRPKKRMKTKKGAFWERKEVHAKERREEFEMQNRSRRKAMAEAAVEDISIHTEGDVKKQRRRR